MILVTGATGLNGRELVLDCPPEACRSVPWCRNAARPMGCAHPALPGKLGGQGGGGDRGRRHGAS